MDTTNFGESQYINVELVKASPSKAAHILKDAEIEQGQFGERLMLTVELDGKQKKWTLNRDNVKALQDAYGRDSKNWVGQNVMFRVLNVQGKEKLVVFPTISSEDVVK